MTRWHINCDNPDIFVDATLPRCRNCGKAPSTIELTPPDHVPPPPWTVPPDEEVGQLNLHWPKCVPYKIPVWTDGSFSDLGFTWLYDKPTVDFEPPENSNRKITHPVAPDSHSSIIYPRCLEPEEFRLLCLEPPQKHEDPVHLTLETYRRDDCPEYEATSYCWGGEDGDNTLSDHVFVGPHWDVIFTTRNCRSMLLYLRPRRGLRILWVDAICITQADVIERGDQIAAMRNIYRGCMRVVVYLGDDIAGDLGSHLNPARYDTENLGEVTPLEELLGRRYFSRVWVIQEIILAPSLVIPLRHMEFRGVLLFSKRGHAPWFRFATMGSMSYSDIDMILLESSKSQATDPRDKVFGVLGLRDLELASKSVIEPDYTITLAHTMIGIIAYILLVERNTLILVGGFGVAAPPPYPSWIPDWKRALMSPRLELELRQVPPEQSWSMSVLDLFNRMAGNTPERYHATIIRAKDRSPDDLGQRKVKSRWSEGASIDAINAGLTITLHSLLEFDAPFVHYPGHFPRRLPHEPAQLYEIQTLSCRLFIVTAYPLVNIKLTPGPHHLFVLPKMGRHTYPKDQVFLLQRVSAEDEYRMVACFMCYEMCLIAKGPPQELQRQWDEQGNHYRKVTNMSLSDSVADVFMQVHDMFFPFSRFFHRLISPQRVIHPVEEQIWQKTYKQFFPLFPDQRFWGKNILGITQAVLNEERGEEAGFVNCYRNNLEENFACYRPKIDEEFVMFEFDMDAWQVLGAGYAYSPKAKVQVMKSDVGQNNLPLGTFERDWWKRWYYSAEVQWQWRGDTPDNDGWKNIYFTTFDAGNGPRGDTIQVRARIADFRRFVGESEYLMELRRLAPIRAQGEEQANESEVLLRDTNPSGGWDTRKSLRSKYESQTCFGWPQVAVDELKMDGRPRKITIV